MSVLCIDIGIKNLAFCLSDENLNIELWKNVDILNEIINCKICKIKAKYRDKDSGLYYCGRHKNNSKQQEKIKEIKLKNIQLNFLVYKLLESLKFLNNLDSNTIIRIELQPAKNPKMKLISHCVYSKCIEIFGYNNVKFMRATQKLKKVNKEEKSTYSDRKKTSIELTTRMLKKHNKINDLTFFNNSQKKSDLADTFLMCCVYHSLFE